MDQIESLQEELLDKKEILKILTKKAQTPSEQEKLEAEINQKN